MVNAPAGLTYPALARVRDVTLALIALVILSPLLLVLAGLARLSTGANGVFSHRRLGKKGRSFLLYKLRTLHPQAPPQVNKGEGESAATPLGRRLRTSKLDELPQLWNVVKGEMSLVGPRPIIPQEYSDKSHYQRLAVKPGLTGLWQLSNHRGNPFDENPEYDLFYLANRSFGFDLWILWRTILLVVLGRETGISLAARLWEKDPSWRKAAPDEFNDVPGGVRVWHLRMAALGAFAVACLSLAVGAGLIGRGWSHALAEMLARRLAGVGSVQVSGLVAEEAEVLNPVQLWTAVGLAVLFSMLVLPAAKWAGERKKLLSRAGVFASSRKLISYLGGPGLALAAVGAFAASAGIPRGFGGLLSAGLVLSLVGLLADRRRQLDQRGAIDSILKYCVVATAILTGAVGSHRGFLGAIGIMVLCAIVMSAVERLDRLGGAGASSATAIGLGVFVIALMTGQYQLAYFAGALSAASLTFFVYNYRRLRVRLGSGGALFLGFTLCASAFKLNVPTGLSWVVGVPVVMVGALMANALVLGVARVIQRDAEEEAVSDPLSRGLIKIGFRKKGVAATYALVSILGPVAVLLALATDSLWILTALMVALAAVAIAISFSVRLRDSISPKTKPHRRRVARRAGLVFGAVIVGCLALAVQPAVAARSYMQSAREKLIQGAESARNLDFAGAQTSFGNAQTYALAAKGQLESPLMLPARAIPLVRGNIQGAHSLASAVAVLAPGLKGAVAASEGLSADKGGLGFSKGKLELGPISALSGPMKNAAASTRLAVQQASHSRGFLLPPLGKARREFIKQASDLSNAISRFALVSEVLPNILGEGEQRTYFLMIQNATEQRGTGGYLGAFAILRAKNGQLTMERFDSNAKLPPGPQTPSPSPEFAARYDRFGSRTAWHNVNMTPDFPTAARMVAQMWESRTKTRIDGVMSIDAFGLAQLLKITGPLSVPELGEQLTSDNFVRLTVNEAYIRFPQKAERVDFLLPVGREVWSKFLSAQSPDPRQLAQVFGGSFSSKHMQLWTRREEKELNRLGIDGALKNPRRSDYLLLVGQNAAGNKVDYYGRRRIDYRATIEPNGLVVGKAKVVLENQTPLRGLPKYLTGPFGNLLDPPGLNRSYLSLYVPGNTGARGAKVDGKPVGLESHQELGLGVISRFIEVPAGRSSSLDLGLFGHSLQKNGEYRLVVQHQPSIHPDVLNLSVTLPGGTAVKQMSPGMVQAGRVVRWKGKLDSDRQFVIKYGSGPSDNIKSRLDSLFRKP